MRLWKWTLLVALLFSFGCEINLGSDGDKSEDDGEKKKKKKKDDDEDEGEDEEGDDDAVKGLIGFESEDPLGIFGDAHGLSGDDHSDIEPSHFDARWVAVEVSLAKKLIKGFKHKSTGMSTGGMCVAYLSNGRVRRMLMGSGRKGKPIEEFWMSSAGHLIFWNKDHAYASRSKRTLEWGFFHRGASLELYQVTPPGGSRHTAATPPGLGNSLISKVNECARKVGASNPQTASRPPQPVPAAPAPGGGSNNSGGGAGQWGAIAFSKSTGAWYMSAHRSSEDEAKQAATGGCRRNDCTVYETYGPGACRSVISRPDKGLSWGRGTNRNEAISNLKPECDKHGITNCTPHAWACNASGGDGAAW